MVWPEDGRDAKASGQRFREGQEGQGANQTKRYQTASRFRMKPLTAAWGENAAARREVEARESQKKLLSGEAEVKSLKEVPMMSHQPGVCVGVKRGVL